MRKMKSPDKVSMQKYLKFQYWTKYLRGQGMLSERDYQKMLLQIRTRCGIS